MAVAYNVTQSVLFSHPYPPPLLPKPGKDNIRLQKLLKRTAKKKAAVQASQSAGPFRSSLSPVNEASPDLEHSDHSTPPKTPEAPSGFHALQQVPRFSIRPLYQHVASPYPQRAPYGRATRFSPQTVATSYTYSEHAAVAPPAPATQPKPTVLGPTPYQGSGAPAVIRPLTVLAPFGKPRSPRPTFKATEPSRSPKPMFDVPQIRMYTATTSYYETSRTPPVFDTAGLTAIGATVPLPKTPTEIEEFTQQTEVRDYVTQMTPSLGEDPKRQTQTSEIKGATPKAEIVKIISPASEVKRVTLITETKRAPPTFESERAALTSESKRETPTLERRVKTPTLGGRPRTPAYHRTRAVTPVFEISRPNPLLFAVSPVTVESEASRLPKSVPSSSAASLSVKTPEQKTTDTITNGETPWNKTPAAKQSPKVMTKSKSEPDLTSRNSPMASPSLPRAKTPTSVPVTQVVTPSAYQRPKTPTYEASRLLTASLGFKRPKTPTYGTPPSPVAFQRPKTPTILAQKSRSTYRGLTPAEYAAYGGIKTYSPAFGIITSKMAPQGEVTEPNDRPVETKEPSQEVPEHGSRVQEPPKEIDKVCATPSIPSIVVSQASDASETTLKQDSSPASGLVEQKEKPSVVQEVPKAKPLEAAEVKSPVSQKVETEVVKPVSKPPEAKRPVSKGDDKDPLKVVRKLFGKDKVPSAEKRDEKKVIVSQQKESEKPKGANKPEATDMKQRTATPKSSKPTRSEVKDAKAEAPLAVTPEKKDHGSLPATEPLLKVIQKPKGAAAKLSGWSRLKKHMVVEQEEPKFPELGSQAEAAGKDQSEATTADKRAGPQDENKSKDTPKATKMWDAVLFQMFSTKENIMHQIELNKGEEQKEEEKKDEVKDIPSFAFRLPVLLFSPKFDAKKLKEAASRPVTKISTVFEMGLIGRKGKEEEPKDFNRTARGFTST